LSPKRSCRRKHQKAATGRRWRSLAANTLSSIADAFKARLEDLQRQSEITDRKVAATIARCHQLIAEEQAAEARWAAEHPE
jgi:hypothetical protein